MNRKSKFFTAEMGRRLRDLRQKKGLSEDQVAERMGLRGKGRWNLIARLEHGRVADPHLSTITFYLRACGALFSEFYDVLTRVQHLPIDPTPIQNTKLSLKRKERVIEQATKMVHKYQERIEYPLVAVPMKPEKQRKATEAFRVYTIQAKIIEQEVLQMLRTEENEAKSHGRTPLVLYIHDSKYVYLARRILSIVRKYDGTADSRRPTPGEAQVKIEVEAERIHPEVHEGRGGSEQESDNKRPNPRKKSLEQRLDEAMSMVKEQRLNEEAAEMVRALVLKRYPELKLQMGRMVASRQDEAPVRVRIAPLPSRASLTSEVEPIVRPYLVGGQSFRLDLYINLAAEMLNSGSVIVATGLPGKAEALKAALDRIEGRIVGGHLNPEALHLVRMAMEKKLGT
jgi:transcriptional regulator with XRE-family HTH domain